MENVLVNYLHLIAIVIESIGVAVIILSAIGSLLLFIKHLTEEVSWPESYHAFRTNFAKGILLGLEFLVAGDIIETVTVKPSLNSLYILALIVLIRTFLSFSLSIEIEGKLPWKRKA
ncbi:MAG: hypothetical protein CME64_01145 [Halobacteriovoraceae bacterium]|nr:hypothetical protein [Halobacteriovoraceae bacterium]|tara:strand:+ start:246235 stop:246585 length:351 start_codon:yes stop_codon:yes gene_type:complete